MLKPTWLLMNSLENVLGGYTNIIFLLKVLLTNFHIYKQNFAYSNCCCGVIIVILYFPHFFYIHQFELISKEELLLLFHVFIYSVIYLFHSLGYNPTLSLLSLLLGLFKFLSLEALSCQLPCPFDMPLSCFFLSILLFLWHYKMLQAHFLFSLL